MSDFLDKILVGINKGVNDMKENSKFLMEKAKLNTDLKELEDNHHYLLLNLGSFIYNKIRDSKDIDIEELLPTFREIQSCVDKINLYKLQIKQIEEEKQSNAPVFSANVTNTPSIVCKCGFANNHNSKFCRQCGNSLQGGI